MKKLFLYGLALLCASNAFAQTSTTTTLNFSVGQTLTLAGQSSCDLQSVTSLTIDSSTNTITANGAKCNPTNPGLPVATVAVTISTANYILGSGAAAPVITWVANPAAGVTSCTLTPPSGFTATASGSTFVLSTPTTAGTYTFTPTCAAAAGYQVSVGSASLTVTPAGTPSACTVGTPGSTVGSLTLKRQCTGSVSYSGNRYGLKGYNGNLYNLGDVLYGAWTTYSSGYSMTPVLTSGSYIALAFTVTGPGSIQFTSDPSYGTAGLISLSTSGNPGKLLPTDSGVICAFGRGSSNSMYITTNPGNYCSVVVGQSYFVNFAAADYSGNELCFNGTPNTCVTTSVSYSEIVGK